MRPHLIHLTGIGMLALGLTACSSPANPAAVPAVPESGTVTPKVNRLVLATVSPAAAEANDMGNLTAPEVWPLRPMYESLFGVDPDTGKTIAQLATDWKVEPDGSSYRVTLRKGVQFQKGYGEFTSADLLPAFKERTSMDYVHGTALYWRRTVANIDIVSPYEAVYRLPKPDANFVSVYASEQSGSMLLFSKRHFEEQGRPTMQAQPQAGTGPYQFDSRKQGEYVRYARVPFDHWRTRPDFPEFEFRWMKEASTRLAALLVGEVHVSDLPPDLLDQATKQNFKLARGRVPGLRAFVQYVCCTFVDLKDPSKGYIYPETPLRDVRVRRALAKATNTDALNKAFFRGKGEPMVNSPFHPKRIGWSPEWEKAFPEEYGYDPAKAKALLAESGYGPDKPFQTTFIIGAAAGFSGAEDIGEAIAAQWRAIGVQVDLISPDATTRNANLRAIKYSNHMMVTGTGSDIWTGLHFADTYGNTGSSPQVAELEPFLPQIEQTLDPQKSDELWRKAGDVVFRSHQYIPLFWLPVEIAYDPKTVADYIFPGAITGSWTHVQNFKAAK